jgi:asparagine synthase (glutamine-hydrolysing)
MRPDPVFLGCYAPAGEPPAALRAHVAQFGAVWELRDGPLAAVAAAGTELPAGGCVLDGWVRDLDAAGAPPGTTDAERIHALWRSEGLAGLARLRGAFALLLWDRERRRGAVVRDQLGSRPVFLHTDGRRLWFATEPSVLVRALPRRPSPDELSVARWIAGEASLGARTLYEGVRRLGPGHAITLEADGWRDVTYWQPRFSPPVEGTETELLGEVRRRMGAAVEAAVRGAQRPGVLLSGGLDSTAVASLAAQNGGRPHAYSAVFPNHPSVDESAVVAAVTERHGLPWSSLRVHNVAVLRGVLEYLHAWDAPDLATTTSFWPLLLGRAASDGVDVMLDGEGGDEIFGTRAYALADATRRGDLRGAWALASRFPVLGPSPGRRIRLHILRRFGVGGLVPRRLTFVRVEQAGILRPRPRALVLRNADPGAWKALDGPRGWAYTAYALQHAGDGRGASEHYARVARLGGVQERHPLLDLDLVAFMLRMPAAATFSPHMTRPLERLAMAGLVPNAVLERPRKSYFDALRVSAIAGEDAPLVAELLGRGARLEQWIPRAKLEGVATAPADSERVGAWTRTALDLLKLECWLRQQEDGAFAERLLGSGRVGAVDAAWTAS